VTIKLFDRVGNWNSIDLTCIKDNTAPMEPVINGIVESSEYIYYSGTILYYSSDQPMSDSITIQIITDDTGVGLFKAVGSADFGGETPEDTSYSGGYDLTYTIIETETAGGDSEVDITIYDMVGNTNTTSLSCTLDDLSPTEPVITLIIESSEHLYFNDSTEIFYYSNDQQMDDVFTIQFTTSDVGGAGRLKAVGSTDFGGETPEDTSYTSGYELIYSVGNGETAGVDNQINITVYDRVGNNQTKVLNCELDNAGPAGVTIGNVVVQSGSQYLYYDSGTETFYYSNDQSMAESFTVQVTAIDAISGNGFELTLTVNQGETEPTFAVKVWDNVGNPTSVALTTEIDNVAPENLQIVSVLESSDFLYYDGSSFYFSNNQPMTTTFKIRVSGSDSDAGRKNATGEDEFGDTGVGNTTYTTYYQLEYTIIQNDDVLD
jgi:hypothetical protein